MENNQRNSRKRLNSLILLVAFTAIMLIVSTYAWFSSQKNVTLTGLHGEVNVAEGLQISLDAQHWVNTISFSDFDQETDGWTVKNTSTTTYFDDASYTFQSPRGEGGGITNVIPDELLPVSTTGYDSTGDGIGETALKFYRGTSQNTKELMNDTKLLAENEKAGYFAFDVYVMNTSAGSEQDVIQLDPISDVRGDSEATGVQNTARVAFALYNNNNDNNETTGANADMTIKDGILDAQYVIAGTSTGKTIKDIAIWEPNADKHTETIVASQANSIKVDGDKSTASSELAKWDGLAAAGDDGFNKFSTTGKLPTFALTSDSVNAGDGKTVHMANVYDWRTTGSNIQSTGLKKQFTLQTNSYETDGSNGITMRPTSVDLVSTGKLETDADAEDTTFTLNPSQYAKIRIYFWMEGQDPDCINAASLGGGLTLDIGFSKPGSDSSAVSGS